MCNSCVNRSSPNEVPLSGALGLVGSREAGIIERKNGKGRILIYGNTLYTLYESTPLRILHSSFDIFSILIFSPTILYTSIPTNPIRAVAGSNVESFQQEIHTNTLSHTASGSAAAIRWMLTRPRRSRTLSLTAVARAGKKPMSPRSTQLAPLPISSSAELHLDLRSRLRGSFSFFVRNGLGDRRFSAEALEAFAAAAVHDLAASDSEVALLHDVWVRYVTKGERPAQLAWVA